MEHFPSFAAILIQVVGFCLLYWLLSTYLFGPVGQVLKDREKTVRDRLDEAESNRVKMITVREDYEKRIAQIEVEARDRIQEATKQANLAREELLTQARGEYDKILEKGRAELRLEEQQAEILLRDRVADLTVLAAGRVLDRNLDSEQHRRLIEDVLREARV